MTMAVPQPLVLLIEDEASRCAASSGGASGMDSMIWWRLPPLERALAQAASRNPDIILLDLGLPDGDGLDLTRRIP